MTTFKYLLETSTCIELLRGNEIVRQKCIEQNQYCCISAITAIELLYGALNAPEKYREQELTIYQNTSVARNTAWRKVAISLKIST